MERTRGGRPLAAPAAPPLSSVLGKVIERPTSVDGGAAPMPPAIPSGPGAAAAAAGGGFPQAFHRGSAGGSRFRQALVDAHSKRLAGGGKEAAPLPATAAAPPASTAGPLVGAGTADIAPADMAAISASNAALVSGMSVEQLQEAVAEVTSLLSPATLAAWRAKRTRAAAAAAAPSAAAAEKPAAARSVRWAPGADGGGGGDDDGLAALSASLSAGADDFGGPVFAGDASDALAALAEGTDINVRSASGGGSRQPLAPPSLPAGVKPAPAASTTTAAGSVFDDAPPPGTVHAVFGRALADAARERLGDNDSDGDADDGSNAAQQQRRQQRQLAQASGAAASSLPPHLLAAYLASTSTGGDGAGTGGSEQHPAAGLIRSLQAAAVASAGVDATGLHASAHLHFVDLRGRLVRQRPAPACGHDQAADGSDACDAAVTAADDGSAGLSLSQLCGLLRSRVPSQRAYAARALTGLLRRRRAAFVGRAAPPPDEDGSDAAAAAAAAAAAGDADVAHALPALDWATEEAPALRALPLPPVLPVLLRCAVDDVSLPALQWGLAALAAFLCPLPDEPDAVACGVAEAAIAPVCAGDGAVASSATDAVAAALALAASPPPPLVTAQPPSVDELASIDGTAGGVPLLLRNCDPADRVTGSAVSGGKDTPKPSASGALVRSAGESAADGLDCLTDPLTVMSHPRRMGLVDRLAAVVGGALAHTRPGGGRAAGAGSRSGPASTTAAAGDIPAASTPLLLLPAVRILTVVAQRSRECAERVATAVAPLPAPSRGGGSSSAPAASVPLLPLLADALLCTDTVTAAVRAAVGSLARGDADLPVPSSGDAASLSLASAVAALLVAVVRSSRPAAVALCEREEGIEATAAVAAGSAGAVARSLAWPGRLTLEGLVQFLPLAAVSAGTTAAEPLSPPSASLLAAPASSAPSVAAALPLVISWRALSLLQGCWRYGLGLDLLPVVYAPATPAVPAGRRDNRPPEDAGSRRPTGAGAADAAQSVGSIEPPAADVTSTAATAYVPPQPGLRVWTEGLADAAAEAALLEDDSGGDEDAPATDVGEAAAAGFATLPADGDAAGAPLSRSIASPRLHMPHWRLLFGCGTLALLAAAADAAAVEAAGGHGLARRLTAALSRRARREAALSAAAAGDTDALAELRRGDGLDEGNDGTGPESAEDVCAEATLLSSQVQAAVSHAIVTTVDSLLPAPAQAASAPPPRQLAAAHAVAMLASYLRGQGATTQAVSVTTLTATGLVTSSLPFPEALQRLLGTADGSGVGGAAPAPTYLAGLPSPLALAINAGGVGEASASLACRALLAPLLQAVVGAVDGDGAPAAALRLRHLLPAVGTLAGALATRWRGAAAAALASGGALALPPAAALLVAAASASSPLAAVPPPALANVGAALPLALAAGPSASSGLASALPVPCAPTAHWAAAHSHVGAAAALLTAAAAVASKDEAAKVAAAAASLWKALLPHCGPGHEAVAGAAVTALAGASGSGNAPRLSQLVRDALLLPGSGVAAAGAAAAAAPAGLVPAYPSAAGTAVYGALAAALPPVLATTPLGLPPHPHSWRVLPLQLALSAAGAYDALTDVDAAGGPDSDAAGAAPPTDDELGLGDVAAALALLQRGSRQSPAAAASRDSDLGASSLRLLSSLDTLFQLLHVGLLPGAAVAATPACCDGLRAAIDATLRQLTALQASFARAPSSHALTSLALLARHPRYGFRGDNDNDDNDGSAVGLTRDTANDDDDDDDDDGTASGASTLLHALIRALVASYGRDATGNGAAALALAALLQQQQQQQQQQPVDHGSTDARGPLAVAARRCAALRHAVWWELGRAGLTGRLVLPLGLQHQPGAADPALAPLLLHPPEGDGRVLEAMAAALVAAEGTADAALDDGGDAAAAAAAGSVPLLALARHHLAHAVFAATSSSGGGSGRLPFTAVETLRRFHSRGALGRAALARLARWGIDDDGHGVDGGDGSASLLRRFCSDGGACAAQPLLPTVEARLARINSAAA